MRDQNIPAPDARASYTAVGSMLGLAFGDCTAAQGGGRITAQTQLALAVADGMVRGWIRFCNDKQTTPGQGIERELRRWAARRGLNVETIDEGMRAAWLASQEIMGERNVPGKSILNAFNAGLPFGSRATNSTLGAACVPMVAPIGLAPSAVPFASESTDLVSLAKDTASITHGHPTAQASAGAFTLLLREIGTSETLEDATGRTISQLKSGQQGTQGEASIPVTEKLQMAVDRSSGGGEYEKASDFAEWKGHRADEALAIGLWAALKADSATDCVSLASASVPEKYATSAIAGAIWGADRGRRLVASPVHPWDFRDGIPQATDVFTRRELESIEGRLAIEEQMASFVRILSDSGPISECDQLRWPGL